jgi:hypothetical protein
MSFLGGLAHMSSLDVCGPVKPPTGAQDNSPWRKPWDSGKRKVLPAPEGRKVSFPDVPFVVTYAVFLEKAHEFFFERNAAVVSFLLANVFHHRGSI